MRVPLTSQNGAGLQLCTTTGLRVFIPALQAASLACSSVAVASSAQGDAGHEDLQVWLWSIGDAESLCGLLRETRKSEETEA